MAQGMLEQDTSALLNVLTKNLAIQLFGSWATWVLCSTWVLETSGTKSCTGSLVLTDLNNGTGYPWTGHCSVAIRSQPVTGFNDFTSTAVNFGFELDTGSG